MFPALYLSAGLFAFYFVFTLLRLLRNANIYFITCGWKTVLFSFYFHLPPSFYNRHFEVFHRRLRKIGEEDEIFDEWDQEILYIYLIIRNIFQTKEKDRVKWIIYYRSAFWNPLSLNFALFHFRVVFSLFFYWFYIYISFIVFSCETILFLSAAFLCGFFEFLLSGLSI